MSNLINFYEKMPKDLQKKYYNPKYKIHGLVTPFRMLIVGSSGSGKTNILLNIIALTSGTFNKCYVLTKNADEPLYNLLKEKLKDQIEIYEKYEDLPKLESFNDNDGEQNLIVFDDICLDNKKQQEPICQYFIRGRKLGCSTIYISQSYFLVPKVIRCNLNYIILKKMSSARDINLILSEYSLGVDKDELLKMYKECTKDRLNFLLIDIDNPDINKKFRFNFNESFIIDVKQ